MNIDEKLTLLRAVEASGFKIAEACDRLDVPRATYYRWRSKFRRFGREGLKDMNSRPPEIWNKLLDPEVEKILEVARAHPEWSSREISFFITDSATFSVSESTVYRLLKERGLIREHPMESFPAGKEYRIKTTRVNQQWQTDATHILVKNWGWFYLISVLDDFSRKILAWELQSSMDAEAFAQVVEKACATIRSKKKPKLVSDRGPALISEDFGTFLEAKGIGHIFASPYHPQTNGKIERYHKTLKQRIYLSVWDSPDHLAEAIDQYIEEYNSRRYHESLGNVTPDDVYFGRRNAIIKKRESKKMKSLNRRRKFNSCVRMTETVNSLRA